MENLLFRFLTIWKHSGPKGIYKAVLNKINKNKYYFQWIKKNEINEVNTDFAISKLSYKPLISIIMPVYNTDRRWLTIAINSVLTQIYTNWELCIADDASTDLCISNILLDFQNKDNRIKVVLRKVNGHISEASNSALQLAKGEYVATLDHDDILTKDALYEVVTLLNRYSDADIIYSDEDKISEKGIRNTHYFKPDWSPDLFFSQMYTAHLAVYRKSLLEKIGGFRKGFEGAQDWDLVLRLTEITKKIYHIPKILYSWRNTKESTSKDYRAKPYAYIAAQKALEQAVKRKGRIAKVEPVKDYPGQFHVHWQLIGTPLISIIICTKDKPDLLNNCLKSIFTLTNYPNFEIIVIDNNSHLLETKELLKNWQKFEPQRFRFEKLDIPFNYSKLNNIGARMAAGQILLFLNNDIEVLSPSWIIEMASHTQNSQTAAVSAMLVYPNKTIQHAGVVLGIGGWAGHSHKGFPMNSPGYAGRLLVSSNYSAVTGACLMINKELFFKLGGFEEKLKVACGDVELCLKAIAHGFFNVVVPYIRLIHHESATRGFEDTPEKIARFKSEIEYVKQQYPNLMSGDPFYNPNLTLEKEDFSLSI